MRRVAWMRVVVIAALALAPAGARAMELKELKGHLAVGYAKLFAQDAPGGSISLALGLDYRLARDWRAGLDVDYDLLGSTNTERGSLFATLDYNTTMVAALVHWTPQMLGPVARVSFGPALMNSHADLSTSGGGAAFSDLAVHETAPAAALAVTLMSKRVSPVRLGAEIGTRIGFLANETWTLLQLRAAVHF